MQPVSGERAGHAEHGLSLNLQAELHAGTTVPAAAADSADVRVSMTGGPGETSGGASSRRSRLGSHSHSHSHGQNRSQHHSSSESELDPPESDVDSGETSASLSELRCLLRWLQKSLPFLVILCAKLVIQHALGEENTPTPPVKTPAPPPHSLSPPSPGLAVGVGLFTTFLYVNKNIQSQVCLQV